MGWGRAEGRERKIEYENKWWVGGWWLRKKFIKYGDLLVFSKKHLICLTPWMTACCFWFSECQLLYRLIFCWCRQQNWLFRPPPPWPVIPSHLPFSHQSTQDPYSWKVIWSVQLGPCAKWRQRFDWQTHWGCCKASREKVSWALR